MRHPRRARLRSSADFQAVFDDGIRVGGRSLSALVRPAAQARLGMAVSRKVSPLAVERNRIKRQIRESFRMQRATLPPLDIVILARAGAAQADNAALRAELAELWRRLVQRCAPSSSS